MARRRRPRRPIIRWLPSSPPRAAKARSVIYLHMAGCPSQLDLFDYKPTLEKFNGQPCPKQYLEGKRFAFIRGVPNMLGTPFKFAKHGQSGAELSRVVELPAARWSTRSPSSARCTPSSSTTPRPSSSCTPARTSWAGRRWARGPRMAWAARTRTCPASSSSPAAARRPTPARASGGAAFCRPSTKGCSAARRATRCCSSPIPAGWTGKAAARRSMP